MFLSNLQKRSTVPAMNKLHEWQDWTLPAPTANAAVEGFTPATASGNLGRTRRSNYVQIFSRTFQIADSVLEGIDIAGIKTEYQFQADANFTALRRDIEWAFMKNVAASAGTSAAAATLAGCFNVISTNVAVPATGTGLAMAEVDVLGMFQKIFTQRGVFFNLDIHAAPVDVARIMAFTGPGTAGKFLMVSETTTVHNRQVSVIVTNFGKAAVIPNNIVATTATAAGKILFADMQTWALAVKVPPKLKALAKTTDSTAAYWKTELTLEYLNESANGQISAMATS